MLRTYTLVVLVFLNIFEQQFRATLSVNNFEQRSSLNLRTSYEHQEKYPF